MTNIIETTNLTKVYKNKLVVNNVNMHIEKGDIYGFVGENGAGKTTLIRLLTGLIHKTSGSFKLFGISDDNPQIMNVKRKISGIVETPSLYLNMNAADNLKMQALVLGIKLGEHYKGILKMVGLENQINEKKKAGNYSLGMRQRLGIAMALVGNPEVIILDEPMNGLDPEGIVEIRNLILKLNKEQNITFIISSHILDELGKVATKYGFIHQGVLVQELTIQELEQICQKKLELRVSNIEQTLNILSELNYQNMRVLNNTIYIYDEYDVTKIVTELAKKNIQINHIYTCEEGIEDYYLRLMGGLKNA